MALDRRILSILYFNDIVDVNKIDEFIGEENNYYLVKMDEKIQKLKIPGNFYGDDEVYDEFKLEQKHEDEPVVEEPKVEDEPTTDPVVEEPKVEDEPVKKKLATKKKTTTKTATKKKTTTKTATKKKATTSKTATKKKTTTKKK